MKYHSDTQKGGHEDVLIKKGELKGGNQLWSINVASLQKLIKEISY
jgi:hypothetical protein